MANKEITGGEHAPQELYRFNLTIWPTHVPNIFLLRVQLEMRAFHKLYPQTFLHPNKDFDGLISQIKQEILI